MNSTLVFPSPSFPTNDHISSLHSSHRPQTSAGHAHTGSPGSVVRQSSASSTYKFEPLLACVPVPVVPTRTSRFALAPSFPHEEPQKELPAGCRLTLSRKRELDRTMQGLRNLPNGWEQYIHLDGKPYFRNASWNVVTEVNIFDTMAYSRLTRLHGEVTGGGNGGKDARHLQLPRRFELYLCLVPNPGYYYANLDEPEVFWLENVALENLGYLINTSVEIWLEREYYAHLENFPVHNEVSSNALATLKAELAYACADHMTSRECSTAAWNKEDSKTFLELLESLEGEDKGEDKDTSVVRGYKTWFAARLLSSILFTRMVYRYGMYNARTDRLAALSDERMKRPFNGFTWLLGNVLSFRAHRTYVKRLEEAWADRIVSLDDWKGLINSLMTEWSDSNLLSTVVLSGNLAFLAISDITDKERAASMVSTFFAIGSIVAGLHHVWRHRVKADTDASHAGKYFRNAAKSVPSQSLRPLAFFLSLPLILLSWSLVAFIVAMVLYAFANKRPVAVYAVVAVVVAAILGVIVVMVSFFERLFAEDEKAKGVWLLWEMLLPWIRR